MEALPNTFTRTFSNEQESIWMDALSVYNYMQAVTRNVCGRGFWVYRVYGYRHRYTVDARSGGAGGPEIKVISNNPNDLLFGTKQLYSYGCY